MRIKLKNASSGINSNVLDGLERNWRFNSASAENSVMFCVLQDHMGTKNQHGNAAELADTRSHYYEQCYITATPTPDNTSLRRTQLPRLTKPASQPFQSWGIPHNHAHLYSRKIDADVLNILQASRKFEWHITCSRRGIDDDMLLK